MAKVQLGDDAPQVFKEWLEVACGEKEVKCICGRPHGHEPPHRCADPQCAGAWYDGHSQAPERLPMAGLAFWFGEAPNYEEQEFDLDVISVPFVEDA